MAVAQVDRVYADAKRALLCFDSKRLVPQRLFLGDEGEEEGMTADGMLPTASDAASRPPLGPASAALQSSSHITASGAAAAASSCVAAGTGTP